MVNASSGNKYLTSGDIETNPGPSGGAWGGNSEGECRGGLGSWKLSYRNPLPLTQFEECLKSATDERVLAVLTKHNVDLEIGPTIRETLRRHLIAANLDAGLAEQLTQELIAPRNVEACGSGGNSRGCPKSYAQAAKASVAGQKTYAQVAASRFGVSAAGDCRRQADAPAVATEPHPEAVARLRSLNLRVLSLSNLGQNNCYANTVATVLKNLPQLRSVLVDEREDNLGPVGKELRRLMLLQNGTKESLQTLRSLVADSLRRWPDDEIAQDYDASRQHDATEFLSTLIECLYDELKTRSEGILNQILKGELRVSRKCLRCGCSSVSVEAMNNPMPLELSRDWAEWILGDLVNFAGDSGKEEVVEKNCFSCDFQNAPHKEIKEYYRLPTILFLSLGRFQARFGNEVETVKIKDPVSVPQDVRVRCSDNHFVEYSLVSYINHDGEEAKSGHYTVSLRDPDTKLFAKCDDAKGFLQATDTGIGLPSEADEAYILTLVMKTGSEPQSPPRKRLNSRSHEAYSPVQGGPAGGATPKQTGGSNGQGPKLVGHQPPAFSPVGHNRGRGVKDLGHGTSF